MSKFYIKYCGSCIHCEEKEFLCFYCNLKEKDIVLTSFRKQDDNKVEMICNVCEEFKCKGQSAQFGEVE